MALPPPVPVQLTTLPSHDCSYLPGRLATTRALRAEKLPVKLYEGFMNAGFRRSGKIIYQPVCVDCHACVPIRIPVARFKPSKSQMRAVRRNNDLRISESIPELTEEKYNLYTRYVTKWHGKADGEIGTLDSLREFLYESPVRTIEFCYRTSENELIGVGICDCCETSLSSVYFYFDPSQNQRSLGTFSVMHEIDWCRQASLPYLHLGYWVDGCKTMAYKSRFQPSQLLDENGIWRDFTEMFDS